MTEPVLMLRAKDFRPKPMSRYSSGSGTGQPKRKRHKNPQKQKPTQQRIMVLDLDHGGKIKWLWRAV